MTIRILDQANAPAQTIQQMKRYIEDRMAFIDVEVKWLDCGANAELCEAARLPNEFWFRILGKIPSDARIDQVGYTSGAPGEGGIPCVHVIYPRIRRLIDSQLIGLHQMLGAAMTHEVGHLFLGSNSQAHSLNGIMCGNWSRREIQDANIGRLNFTRDQGARIRASMRRSAEIWLRSQLEVFQTGWRP